VAAARRAGVDDPRVLDAMRRMPRAAFVPPDWVRLAYNDAPVPIPHRQVTTQPSLSARMVQALRLTGVEHVLEVGTGYGYQTVLLARVASFVTSIERWPDLAEQGPAQPRRTTHRKRPHRRRGRHRRRAGGSAVRRGPRIGGLPAGPHTAGRPTPARRPCGAADRTGWRRACDRVRAHPGGSRATRGGVPRQVRAPARPPWLQVTAHAAPTTRRSDGGGRPAPAVLVQHRAVRPSHQLPRQPCDVAADRPPAFRTARHGGVGRRRRTRWQPTVCRISGSGHTTPPRHTPESNAWH
jgi:Protein-L-isoaspartate(D-aspartate) O-methyltransferase (PCMT)